MPRIAHVRTSERSVHSARLTAAGSSPSTRAHSVSSADDCTWACSPQMRETTAGHSAAGARCARPWRATRQAMTASQLSASDTPRNLTHVRGCSGELPRSTIRTTFWRADLDTSPYDFRF